MAALSGHHEIADMIASWTMSYILQLPYDVLLHVFQFLEPHDLCSVAQTCKVERTVGSVLWSSWSGPHLACGCVVECSLSMM